MTSPNAIPGNKTASGVFGSAGNALHKIVMICNKTCRGYGTED